MPKGPQGQKRPADVIGAAIMVGRIATGEIADSHEKKQKNPHAVALGKEGGKRGGPARAKKLSSNQLSDIGKKASAARWSKRKAGS